MTVYSARDPLYVPRLLLFEPLSKTPVARSFSRMTKFTRLALATAVAALGISETAIARARHARYPLPQSVTTSDGSGPVDYLLDARFAVSASQYARASEALGRAETRLLNDAAISPNRTPPYLQRALTDVASARATATRHQPTPTVRAINDALLALEPRAASQSAEVTTSEPIELLPVTSSPPFQSSPVIPAPSAQPTPAPAILYRLDPDTGSFTVRRASGSTLSLCRNPCRLCLLWLHGRCGTVTNGSSCLSISPARRFRLEPSDVHRFSFTRRAARDRQLADRLR